MATWYHHPASGCEEVPKRSSLSCLIHYNLFLAGCNHLNVGLCGFTSSILSVCVYLTISSPTPYLSHPGPEACLLPMLGLTLAHFAGPRERESCPTMTCCNATTINQPFFSGEPNSRQWTDHRPGRTLPPSSLCAVSN